MKRWVKELKKLKRYKKYSQSYQDSVIEHVFKHIDVNQTPFCVEFGYNTNTLPGGSGPNTAKLILDNGWDHIFFDGSRENKSINLYKHYLSSKNICDLFEKYNVPLVPDYISIDVDSTDLWLFESLIKKYRASLFSVEFNCHYPLDRSITFPNDSNEVFEHDRGYGASLKALKVCAENNGYSLIWVVDLLDAFFIRNDLIEDGTDEIVFPYETWKSHTSRFPGFSILKNPQRISNFLDYEVYLETQDLKQAQDAAQEICKQVLLK